MAKPNSVDWEPIKIEYITTKVSYRQLSDKYGVSIAQISRVAKRDKWREQRERHAEKCFRKAADKAANMEAARLSRLIDATTRTIDVAMRAVDDERQFNRYIVSDGLGGGVTETTEREFDKIDTKALRDFTAVIKDLTGLMREFYNIPTPAQAEAQRIAAARLELERKRAEPEDKDNTVEVVLAPELEELAE